MRTLGDFEAARVSESTSVREKELQSIRIMRSASSALPQRYLSEGLSKNSRFSGTASGNMHTTSLPSTRFRYRERAVTQPRASPSGWT